MCILWYRNDISKKQIKNTIGFPSGANPGYDANVFKRLHIDRRKPTSCDHKTLENHKTLECLAVTIKPLKNKNLGPSASEHGS